MRLELSIVCLVAAALAACGEPAPAVDAGAPSASTDAATPVAPGTLELSVALPPTDGVPTTELWLRPVGGETRFHFLGSDGTLRIDGLTPGEYDVAAKIGFELNGPWIYAHERFVVAPDRGARVALALPNERRAGFALRVADDTPPFFLALAEEGASFPSDPRALHESLAQAAFPEGRVFALQSDGRKPSLALPNLPAGRYVLFQVANDWQDGDPVPQGRTLDVELVADRTTTLVLEEKLTRMHIE
jgi:hypothetical protein